MSLFGIGEFGNIVSIDCFLPSDWTEEEMKDYVIKARAKYEYLLEQIKSIHSIEFKYSKMMVSDFIKKL